MTDAQPPTADAAGDADGALSRRGMLAAILAGAGFTAFSAGRASAATPTGSVEAGEFVLDQWQLNGRSTAPSTQSGDAALWWDDTQ